MLCRRVCEPLLGLILVGTVVGAPALPAPSYAGCADCARTTARVFAPPSVEAGDRAVVRVRITSRGGGRPRGEVSLVLTRPDGTVLPARARTYRGEPVTFRTHRLQRRGRWSATVVFLAAPGTHWKESLGGARIRVR